MIIDSSEFNITLFIFIFGSLVFFFSLVAIYYIYEGIYRYKRGRKFEFGDLNWQTVAIIAVAEIILFFLAFLFYALFTEPWYVIID